MKYEDRVAWMCPVFAWDGDLKRCRACDGSLTGRQQRWCSDRCSDHYGRNHWWGHARVERLRLDDYTCQRCEVRSEPRMSEFDYIQRHRVYGRADGLTRFSALRLLLTGPALEVNHVWPLAQQFRERKRYGKTPAEDWTEMVPIRHADSGCHHHLSLLVTLCKACHRRITNQQFGFKQAPQLSLEVA